ncbi:hypothetical protein [Campylobacter geochelonis]|uniref:hypothetical protein n=1 Tax=Campylobacter geochelonis TaxID=1780362 RepID=UPI00094DD42B|nr:hypothetical protein [Campylobacter geochelonis]
MKIMFKFSFILWGLFLCLNLLNLLNLFKFSGVFYSMVWFALSLVFCFFIWRAFKNSAVLSRVLLFITAFISAFFTAYLYYGFVDLNSFYFAFLSAIIALSLTLGVGVLA